MKILENNGLPLLTHLLLKADNLVIAPEVQIDNNVGCITFASGKMVEIHYFPGDFKVCCGVFRDETLTNGYLITLNYEGRFSTFPSSVFYQGLVHGEAVTSTLIPSNNGLIGMFNVPIQFKECVNKCFEIAKLTDVIAVSD